MIHIPIELRMQGEGDHKMYTVQKGREFVYMLYGWVPKPTHQRQSNYNRFIMTISPKELN